VSPGKRKLSERPRNRELKIKQLKRTHLFLSLLQSPFRVAFWQIQKVRDYIETEIERLRDEEEAKPKNGQMGSRHESSV
jgi:hypothetical protein